MTEETVENDIAQSGETIDFAIDAEPLKARLRIFTLIRWMAILGIAVITLVARYIFHIHFPVLPIFIIGALMVIYNLALIWQNKGLARLPDNVAIGKARRTLFVHIYLDMLFLTVLIHFSGGIENPFIFFYIFHIILASIDLNPKSVYVMSATAVSWVIYLVCLEYFEIIPHINLEGFVQPLRYQDVSWILAVVITLASVLFGTSFIITSVISELKKRHRRLEEQRSHFLSFIGIAAHDLKAPLGAVQNFMNLMLGGFAGEISEKQRGLLEKNTKRISELFTLISDLLDVPRIETGKIVSDMKEISLGQIIDHTIDNQRFFFREKEIKLNVIIPDGLPKIYGSAPRMEQALTNLVNNAVKYSPKGSVTIAARERGRDLLVEISDTGIGIPQEDLPHIFEDFFRAKNASAGGTGLGLSITRRIIEAHGGKIWVESPCLETNSGSKFSFTLPGSGKTRGRQRQ